MKILNGFIQAVIIVLTLLPFVDSLVFRTPSNSYSKLHANQLYDIHKGEYCLCLQSLYIQRTDFRKIMKNE